MVEKTFRISLEIKVSTTHFPQWNFGQNLGTILFYSKILTKISLRLLFNNDFSHFAVPEDIQDDLLIEAIEKQQKLILYMPSKMVKKYEKFKNVMELAYGGVGLLRLNSTVVASEMDFEIPFSNENVRRVAKFLPFFFEKNWQHCIFVAFMVTTKIVLYFSVVLYGKVYSSEILQ